MRYAGRLGPEQFWDRVHSGHARIRAATIGWPLYGLDGWTGPLVLADADFEGTTRDQSDEELTGIGLGHGYPDGWHPFLTVHVTTAPARELVARLRVMNQASGGHFSDILRLREEEPSARAEICVAGVPRSFDLWREDRLWFASAARPDPYAIVLEARSVEPAWVNLVPLRDIEPYLAGYEARLRRIRNERPRA